MSQQQQSNQQGGNQGSRDHSTGSGATGNSQSGGSNNQTSSNGSGKETALDRYNSGYEACIRAGESESEADSFGRYMAGQYYLKDYM